MQYRGVLLAVRDLDRSRRFYREALGLKVLEDFGANVALEGGIYLQTLDSWQSFIQTDRVVMPSNAGELYFEEADLNGLLERLKAFDIQYVHPPVTHRWGQRVVRFYDPDGHIIEVGEKMDAVVRRFVRQGLSMEETAARMDVPLEFVQKSLQEP